MDSQKSTTSRLFCPYAFNGLTIKPNGNISPCWRSDLIIPVDAYSQPLSVSFNSEELIQLRKKLSDGQRAESCNRCWRQEDAGTASERQKALKKYSTPRSGNLELLSPSLGNLCDKTCMQCGDMHSSSWAAFKERMSPPSSGEAKHAVFSPRIKWKASDLKHLQEVFLFTTEAMNQRDFPKLMQLLDDAGQLSRALFHIETAGGFLPPEPIRPYLEKIEHLEIAISVDGHGLLNHYIRYPTPWEDVQKTVVYWKALKEKHPHWKLRCETTLSVFNTLGLDEVFEWSIASGLGEPNINEIHSPWYLSLDVLTFEQRKWLASKNKTDKIKNILLRDRPERLDLPPQELRVERLKYFLQYATHLKDITFKDVHPELYHIYFDD